MPVFTAPDKSITRRRIAFAILCAVSWGAGITLAASCISPDSWSLLSVAIVIFFAAYIPWQMICVWNAIVGLFISSVRRDGPAYCCPPMGASEPSAPISASTAVLMCIRNEDTAAVFRRITAVLDELAATGTLARFHLYLLSDTTDAPIAEAEEAAMAALDAMWRGRLGGITYRRRLSNPGFKAGNIRDFCERWGGAHDFALVLDADSFMSGKKILACIRIMQANPGLGILQCLTVGLPSLSPLARIFQFGMRLGMRAYTLGGAWWQADCGPYWGHNALIRLQPFIAHCDLPLLPGKPPFGGDILSHDQVEAVLMRRAGYEVRVIPEEGGSYEENPPTMIEFLRRDLRWCLGNLQYVALLGLPGLKLTSRVQLAFAIWMFLGTAFHVGFWLLVLAQSLLQPDGRWLQPGPALCLVTVMVLLALGPKIATAIAVLIDRDERARWGGSLPFLLSFSVEIIVSFLITPIMATSETVAIGLLCFGRTIGWQAQTRGEHAVPWGEAARRFWPHMLAGIVIALALGSISVATALWSLPLHLGLLVAIPFAVVTSSPRLGVWMASSRALAIPEDLDAPAELAALDLLALKHAS